MENSSLFQDVIYCIFAGIFGAIGKYVISYLNAKRIYLKEKIAINNYESKNSILERVLLNSINIAFNKKDNIIEYLDDFAKGKISDIKLQGKLKTAESYANSFLKKADIEFDPKDLRNMIVRKLSQNI